MDKETRVEKFHLEITPSIDRMVRHKIEDLLEEEGFEILGGGQTVAADAPGGRSDVSFERRTVVQATQRAPAGLGAFTEVLKGGRRIARLGWKGTEEGLDAALEGLDVAFEELDVAFEELDVAFEEAWDSAKKGENPNTPEALFVPPKPIGGKDV